mgnify:CR=1 FL=1
MVALNLVMNNILAYLSQQSIGCFNVWVIMQIDKYFKRSMNYMKLISKRQHF